MALNTDHSKTLLTHIPLGIQENDLEGVITYSNPAHHQLLGYDPGEIFGKTIYDMLPTPKQRQELKEYLAYLVAEQPEPTPYFSFSYRKDGTLVPTRIDWNYLRDDNGQLRGFISAISDYSDYQELKEKLQLERDLARHYLDVAQFMLLILDAEGNISLVNHELCTVLGYSTEELIGKNWFLTCVPPTQQDMIYGLFKEMISGKAKFMAFFEAEVLAANGETHLISWRNSELRDAEGKVCGYICSGEDITERRQIEKEKLQLQEELQLSQKIEAYNRLTAGIAHDFNNLLASILGYADMALDTVTKRGDAELQRYLTEVVNESEKARDMIKQMLTFARGKHNQAAALPALPLIKETIKALQTSAGDAVVLSVNDSEPVPDIEMPPQQLHQLLLYSMAGADESFATTEAKHISVNLSSVTLEQQQCPACNNKISGKFVEISICDDGPGIAPETLNELFNPLPSTKYTTTTRGLLHAQSILHNHHGHIAIESIPGYGTTTRLLIPATGSDSPLDTQQLNSRTPTTSWHIMIVDDKASIAHLKGELLSLSGCEVEVFSDSIAALKQFQLQPNKYDCILIKCDMPSLDGTALSLQLLQQRPELPIILFALKDNDIEQAPPKADNLHIVTKPIPAEKLTTLIYELVGQHG